MLGCRVPAAAFAAVWAVLACSSSPEKSTKESETSTSETVGVLPWDFQCESLAPDAEVARLLGAHVERAQHEIEPPNGVARPCAYIVTTDEYTDAGVRRQEAWSFDLDCRPGAENDAKSLMRSYMDSAGDAGSNTVSVGKGGLDHRGLALIFMDDDAPCYVRVHGPDADRRLALAEMISAALHEENAPMLGRSFRRQ